MPEREGMVFAGWFEDPEFTTPVVVLGRDVLEDVTVYACWDEEVTTGTGYVWEVSGEYYNGDIRHTVEGTVREEVLAERDGAYYIQTTSDLTYTWPTGSTTDDSVRGRWSDGAGETLTYVGIGETGGYTCTVWESEDGTRYWLYHLTLQVRAEVDDGTTHIVHQLAEVYTFEPETSFVPDVSAEYPLEVRGAGTESIGDRLELTAVGEGFTGWYSGGELVTTERTLVVDRVDPTCSYEARSSDGYTVLDQTAVGLGDLGFADGSVITDWDGNVVTGYGSLEPGYYVVTDATGDVTIGGRINVTGDVRLLESCLHNLMLQSQFTGHTVTEEMAIEVINCQCLLLRIDPQLHVTPRTPPQRGKTTAVASIGQDPVGITDKGFSLNRVAISFRGQAIGLGS